MTERYPRGLIVYPPRYHRQGGSTKSLYFQFTYRFDLYVLPYSICYSTDCDEKCYDGVLKHVTMASVLLGFSIYICKHMSCKVSYKNFKKCEEMLSCNAIKQRDVINNINISKR